MFSNPETTNERKCLFRNEVKVLVLDDLILSELDSEDQVRA